MADITLLPSAKVPLIYEGDVVMTTEWYRFFWNVYGFTANGVISVDKGGTGLNSIGDRQLIIGNASGAFEPAQLRGFGINVTYDPGYVNLALGASGVTPGTYGNASTVGQFTINQYGAITFADNISIAISANQIVSGQLPVIYGGTGASTAAGARANLSAAILGANNDITSMTALTGGISTPDYIAFDTAYATTLTAGQLGWDGNNTLGLGMAGGNVIQHIGEDQFFYCKATSAITKGQVVMFTGAVGASGVPTGAPATGITDGTYIMGIAAENIALNGFGLVQAFGTLRNVNTSAYVDGDILWYNPAVTGGLTSTKPSAPNVKVQMAAVINGGSSGGGTILIRINPGSTFGGTDSNAQITSPSNGQIITYDGTNTYWKNTTLTAGSGVSISASATGVLTISASGLGGDVVGPASATDEALARYDGTTGKLIQNSSATLNDSGQLTLGTGSPVLTGLLTLRADAGAAVVPAIALDGYGNTTYNIGFRRAGGTIASPTATLATSVISILGATTGDGTTYANTAAFQSLLESLATTTSMPTAFTFATTAVGAIARREVIRINSNGDLKFSITGQRISGDMSTTTFTNRLSFQTTTVNGATSISALPNGTGVASNINCYNNSDPTNAALLLAGINSTAAIIQSTIRGTGTYLPLAFYTNGAEQIRVTTNGGVSFGATGTAYGTTGQVLTSAGDAPPIWTTPTTGTVTSVTGTSPVSVATGTTTPVISLASGYGDTQNPYASKTANYFLAAPNGSAGVPTFRAIVAADIPALSYVTSVSGTGTVNGITLTGTVTSSGSLTLGGTLSGIGNSQLTNSTISGVALGGNLFNLTAGTGISFSSGTTYNGSAAITINATSTGTVTSVAALTLGTTGTDLSSTVANGTTTPVITLNVPTASATNRGALSSTDWSTFNGKQAALVSGTNIKTVGGVSLLGSGDVGTIGTAYGGTGLTTFTANRIFYASSTSVIAQSAGLTFDGTNFATTGSATAASFIPSSSTVPTNGMYLSSANTLAWSTNSTFRMSLDSAGTLSNSGAISSNTTVTATTSLKANLALGSGAGIDTSGQTGLVVAASSNALLLSGAGYYLVPIAEVTATGQNAVYVLGNGNVSLLGGTGSWVASTSTPGVSQISIAYVGGNYRLYNGYTGAGPYTFKATVIRMS